MAARADNVATSANAILNRVAGRQDVGYDACHTGLPLGLPQRVRARCLPLGLCALELPQRLP